MDIDKYLRQYIKDTQEDFKSLCENVDNILPGKGKFSNSTSKHSSYFMIRHNNSNHIQCKPDIVADKRMTETIWTETLVVKQLRNSIKTRDNKTTGKDLHNRTHGLE